MQARLVVTGAAAPETVWERYRDLRLWPTWSPQVRGVQAPSTDLARGLRGTVVGPLAVRVPFEVLAVDAVAMTWRWRARILGQDVVLDHAVRPSTTAPDGTTTELRLTGPAAIVVAYRPLASVALHRLVRP